MPQDLQAGFPAGKWTEQLVQQSLFEDIGSGDASTAVTVDPNLVGKGYVTARECGFIAGLPLLDILFGNLDERVTIKRHVDDGSSVKAGDVVATLAGPVASLLTGERTALNFLQHLGGIASLTAQYVAETAGTVCQVLDTRKTLPGYRQLAKYAVRCGGGTNHRMGLYDRIMLKDNHWAASGGSIADLVARSRSDFPDLAVEVEVDDMEQMRTVLPLGVEWILLDNFSPLQTTIAVSLRDEIGPATLLESSGNVTLETIGEYARTGVDAVSVGRLTHSALALDLGLDMESQS